MAVVTIKDIAKTCGVSFSTVSKALKGSSEISAETIKYVSETAKKMGYYPNSAARTLRTNRSYDIGVIFEDATGSGLQHQYFAKIFDAINVVANAHGYDITFLNHEAERDYLSQARYRGCDGIAIASSDFSRSDILALVKSEVPTCTLDFVYDKNHSAVISDNTAGMKALMEYIISMGHKKIAFVHGEMSEVTKFRLEAFKKIAQEHNLCIPPGYLITAKYHSTETSEAATWDLLALDDCPTCIVYPDDFACMGGVRILTENGLQIGKDISIAGYDGTMLASLISPQLTTYEQDAKEIGTQMAKMLINQIENPKTFIPSILTVKGTLLKGNSIVCLNSQ